MLPPILLWLCALPTNTCAEVSLAVIESQATASQVEDPLINEISPDLAKAMAAIRSQLKVLRDALQTQNNDAVKAAEDSFRADKETWTKAWTATSDELGKRATDSMTMTRASVLRKCRQEVELGEANVEEDRAIRMVRLAASKTDEDRATAAELLANAKANLVELKKRHAEEDSAADARNQKVADQEQLALTQVRSAAFNWELIGGAQLSQSDGRFTKLREFVRFNGSERFGGPDFDKNGEYNLFSDHSWTRLYSSTGVELGALPTKPAAGGTTNGTDNFADSDKAATFDVTAEYRLMQWRSSADASTGSVSFLLRQRVSAFTSTPTNSATDGVDAVEGGYGIGIRIAEHEGATRDNRNPLFYRYFLATFGDEGQLGNRLFILEGQLRFGKKANTGMFLGARATLGTDDREDSFSILFGINDVAGFLGPIFDKLGSTFSGS